MNIKNFPIAITIILGVIMVAVATAYYFFVSLPQFNNQQALDQEIASCATQAKITFQQETKSGGILNETITPGDYSDYYNPMTHQCFVSFGYWSSDQALGAGSNQSFMNVWENTDIADCGKYLNMTTTICINNLATSTPAEISQSQYSELVSQYTNGQLQ